MDETRPVLPTAKRGRPARSEAEVVGLIAEAALSVLLEVGYAATTVEGIASKAGLAKKTVYRHASNKEDLIGLAVRQWSERLLPAMSLSLKTAGDAKVALVTMLESVSAQVLSEPSVRMFKLLMQDFPGRSVLLEKYNANGVEHARELVAAWLKQQHREDALVCTEPERAARLLLAMAIAEPLRAAVLGISACTQGEQRRHIIACVDALCDRAALIDVGAQPALE